MDRRKAVEMRRDDSFKRPGAVPFMWEAQPGVPKEQYLQQKTPPPPRPEQPLTFEWEVQPGVPKEQDLQEKTTPSPAAASRPMQPFTFKWEVQPPPRLRRSTSEAPSSSVRRDHFFSRVPVLRRLVNVKKTGGGSGRSTGFGWL